MDTSIVPEHIHHLLPSELIVDHGRNLSRAGKRHDPAYIQQLAERFLDSGQTTPVEIYRLPDDPPDAPWRLGAGFGRWEAANFVISKNLGNALFSGRLRCAEIPAAVTAGKTAKEIEEAIQNRNLDENIHRTNISLIDEALAVHYLVTAPEDGGRGEDIRVVAARIGKKAEDVHKLRKLFALGERARDLVRANFRDKEIGLDPVLAFKLANRTEDEQNEILDKSKDAAGRITPKAVRAVIAPAGGRQGQPEAVTGASLANVIQRFERLAKSSSELKKKEVTAAQVNVIVDVLRALLKRDEESFAALPGKLGTLLQTELNKT